MYIFILAAGVFAISCLLTFASSYEAHWAWLIAAMCGVVTMFVLAWIRNYRENHSE